jgi:acetyl coenzyme A synthetase (ADP forming)-like protein
MGYLNLNPKSIAIVGASHTPGKVGYNTLRNILVSCYKGAIYPVNPKGGEILGLKCYSSLLEIKNKIEMAVIITPAVLVPSVIADCAKKNVETAVVISSGFSEVGRPDLEKELLKVKGGVRIIGPNVLGIKDPWGPLDATFSYVMPKKGRIGLISQSGAMLLGMTHLANEEAIGLSLIVSVGNKIDVDDADLIDYFNEDPHTKVIAMYLEQVKNGDRFIKAAKKSKKSIVAVKAGRSEAGLRAAASHTGAMGGSDKIYDSAFRQAGITRAFSVTELFDYANALALMPRVRGSRIGIVTNGGGLGITIADACESLGLEVPQPSSEILKRLRDPVPKEIKPGNPADLGGLANFSDYREAGKALIEDNKIDGVIMALVQTGLTKLEEYTSATIEVARRGKELGKPTIGCWMGGKQIRDMREILAESEVPIYPSVSRAAKVMAMLCSCYTK